MTIYLPRSPWEEMMPQLVGQMAMAKFRQSLQPKEDPELYPGKEQYWKYDKKTGKLVEAGGKVKGTTPNLQRKTRKHLIEGELWAQDYNYDPGGGPDEFVGRPYLSKDSGDTNIDIKMSSAGEREKLAKGETTLNAINQYERLFDEAFVGPVAGRVGQVKNIFGGNPEKQSEFYAYEASIKNQVIKEITGAQMSEVEATRIMKEIPLSTDHPKVWKAKMRKTRANLKYLQAARLRIMEQSGIKTPGGPIEITPALNDPLGIR